MPTLVGTVARIAPVAVNGSVAVDVVLATIAPGLRPAQNVDGTIELFRRARVLTIARPVNARDDTEATLFRVTADGTRAVRTTVRLGAGSADRVAVLAGLRAGEGVIVSDMAAYAASPDLRIVP
jgi:HlyD family secretion protein